MDDPAYWTKLSCRIAQGDREAESDLARWFHPRIRVLASVRLHGSDAAKDVAQDTIVAALDALRSGHVREPERLPAFVLGIARNLINNHYRQEADRRKVPADPPIDPAGDAPDVTRLDDARRRAQVREALATLSAVDRRILKLTLLEGMHPREIAPLLGLTPEVVRTRKSRAVRAMADIIHRRDTKRAAQPRMSEGKSPAGN